MVAATPVDALGNVVSSVIDSDGAKSVQKWLESENEQKDSETVLGALSLASGVMAACMVRGDWNCVTENFAATINGVALVSLANIVAGFGGPLLSAAVMFFTGFLTSIFGGESAEEKLYKQIIEEVKGMIEKKQFERAHAILQKQAHDHIRGA